LHSNSLVIKKEIIAQRVTKKELSLKISNDIYNSFEDLIYSFITEIILKKMVMYII
jgi:hypothetical protein